MTERKAFIDPYWAILCGCVLATVLIVLFFLIDAGNRPARAEDRCAGIGVIASAVRVQGYAVAVETDPAKVALVLSLLKANGLPETAQADGLFFVKMPTGIRVSFIVDGCLSGMGAVDHAMSEEIRRIVKFELAGRDT